jgi:hypothetical protein
VTDWIVLILQLLFKNFAISWFKNKSSSNATGVAAWCPQKEGISAQ